MIAKVVDGAMGEIRKQQAGLIDIIIPAPDPTLGRAE